MLLLVTKIYTLRWMCLTLVVKLSQDAERMPLTPPPAQPSSTATLASHCTYVPHFPSAALPDPAASWQLSPAFARTHSPSPWRGQMHACCRWRYWKTKSNDQQAKIRHESPNAIWCTLSTDYLVILLQYSGNLYYMYVEKEVDARFLHQTEFNLPLINEMLEKLTLQLLVLHLASKLPLWNMYEFSKTIFKIHTSLQIACILKTTSFRKY